MRIHADEPAARAAAALNARAFTVGSHVVFGRGEYAPETPPGQQLLAHELTHVAQQAAGAASGVQRRLVVNPAEGRVYSDPADPRTQKLDDLEGDRWRSTNSISSESSRSTELSVSSLCGERDP